MKLFILILSLFFCSNLLAQAELDRVRNMFPQPNEELVVEIWKGNLSAAHPVEFYWASRGGDVQGYYRIISSGQEFNLEGEKTELGFILSEYDYLNQEIGRIVATRKVPHQIDEQMSIQWYNLENSDLLEIELEAVRFSDYPTPLFRPQVRKYVHFDKEDVESYLIEDLHDNEIIIHHSKSKFDTDYRIIVQKMNPLDCTIVQKGDDVQFNELQNKLRVKKDGGFEYFDLDNTIEIRKRAYASAHFLMDIDYPRSSSESFNSWIEEEINKREKEIKKEVKQLRNVEDVDPSTSHYYYKWNSWTEIDYLSDNLVSGRIVFVNSWQDKLETFSFVYDFANGEVINIKDQFKRDFNIEDYFDKFIRSEITKKTVANDQYTGQLTSSDFSEYSLSENNLLIATPFHWMYGYQKLEIPYSDLEGLLKRNSILKTAMK